MFFWNMVVNDTNQTQISPELICTVYKEKEEPEVMDPHGELVLLMFLRVQHVMGFG